MRETIEGSEREDWTFGKHPGGILFVTLENSKVVKIKEAYAGLGAEAAAPIPTPHLLIETNASRFLRCTAA